LRVDRSASPSAGLRSASVEKTNHKSTTHPAMRSLLNIPFPRRAAASFNALQRTAGASRLQLARLMAAVAIGR